MIDYARNSLVVGIHQPNFFPWLGYFHKIAQSDIFILLDDVEFSKGSFTNRIRIKIGDEQKWLTMPVQYKSTATIAELAIGDTDWRDVHMAKLRSAYGTAPAFNSVFPLIEKIYADSSSASVASFNSDMIKALALALSIETEFKFSSSLHVDGKSGERLMQLTKNVGGNTYLSGQGGRKYQSEETFRSAGLNLVYTNFSIVEYSQLGVEFIGGLSILDALFNVGFEKTRELVIPSR